MFLIQKILSSKSSSKERDCRTITQQGSSPLKPIWHNSEVFIIIIIIIFYGIIMRLTKEGTLAINHSRLLKVGGIFFKYHNSNSIIHEFAFDRILMGIGITLRMRSKVSHKMTQYFNWYPWSLERTFPWGSSSMHTWKTDTEKAEMRSCSLVARVVFQVT